MQRKKGLFPHPWKHGNMNETLESGLPDRLSACCCLVGVWSFFPLPRLVTMCGPMRSILIFRLVASLVPLLPSPRASAVKPLSSSAVTRLGVTLPQPCCFNDARACPAVERLPVMPYA